MPLTEHRLSAMDREQAGFFLDQLLQEAIDAPPKLRARRDDPETSHEASASTENKVAASQQEVLHLLTEYGPSADHELVARHAGPVFSPQRLRSARAELADAGRVVFAGEFRRTPSGRRARVWRLA